MSTENHRAGEIILTIIHRNKWNDPKLIRSRGKDLGRVLQSRSGLHASTSQCNFEII